MSGLRITIRTLDSRFGIPPVLCAGHVLVEFVGSAPGPRRPVVTHAKIRHSLREDDRRASDNGRRKSRRQGSTCFQAQNGGSRSQRRKGHPAVSAVQVGGHLRKLCLLPAKFCDIAARRRLEQAVAGAALSARHTCTCAGEESQPSPLGCSTEHDLPPPQFPSALRAMMAPSCRRIGWFGADFQNIT